MLKKTGLLYAAATVLYLPFAIYAGYYAKGSLVTNVLKMIFFDGTFYHLWYLPAVLIGVLLVWLLGRRCSLEILLIIAGMLYLLGLLGDSYYGVIQQIPWLEFTYQGGFEIFSYTRNGLFFAPIFLAMGAWIAQSPHRFTRRTNLIGFLVSMLAMLFEGMLLRQWDFLRHDSMYIALLPCVFFLCQLLLSCKGRTAKKLRSISMLIYILHPLFIIALRGIARIFNLTDLLIENSLVQYLVVCILSVACSVLLSLLPLPCKKKGFSLGRAWIELDLKNLRNNVSALQGLLPKTCQLMPAVKANAYGHGDIIICKELNRLAIRVFCVATVLEGVHLRQHGIKGDILVLSYTHPYQFHLLKRYRLMQTVIDAQYAALLNHYSHGKKLKVHIKIDTGMHRLGESFSHIDELVNIFHCKNLLIEGAYTHLCVADSVAPSDKAITQLQIQRFYGTIEELKERGLCFPNLHIQSSSGVLHCPELHCDYARVGIALYGVLSSKEETERCPISLFPVLSVKTRIELVRPLRCGESVGYGLQFTAPYDMQIAVLSIGFADGIPRSLSCGVGHALVLGQKAPILGRICMDQIFVDVTNLPAVQSGDIAVIIGKFGEEEITVGEIASQADTISNEILSRLGSRLERVCSCNP